MKIYTISEITDEPRENFNYVLIVRSPGGQYLNVLQFKKTDKPLTEQIYKSEGAQKWFDDFVDLKRGNVRRHPSEQDYVDASAIWPNLKNWLKYNGQREIVVDKGQKTRNYIYPCSLYTTDLSNLGFMFSSFNNQFAASYQTKNPWYWINENGSNSFGLFFPIADSTLATDSDAVIVFQRDSGLSYKCLGMDDVPVENIDCPQSEVYRNFYYTKLREIVEAAMPKIVLTAPETCPASGCDITINCVYNNLPLNETVYLEHDFGYLSKTELKLVDGQGTVKFIPMGLDANDIATIKVGFRLYTGIARLAIPLSA